MKHRKESKVLVSVESYVTLRSDWPDGLQSFVPPDYNARGHRVVGGKMEWKYFADEPEAITWANAAHQGTVNW